MMLLAPFYPPRPRRVWPNTALYKKLIADPGWVVERKMSGWRCLVQWTPQGIKIYSRHRRPIDLPVPRVRDALHEMNPPMWTIIDGELISTEDVLHVIDLPQLGEQRQAGPLSERKPRLNDMLASAFRHSVAADNLRDAVKVLPFLEPKEGAYERCLEDGNEGVVFKKLSSLYVIGMGSTDQFLDWIKVKKATHGG